MDEGDAICTPSENGRGIKIKSHIKSLQVPHRLAKYKMEVITMNYSKTCLKGHSKIDKTKILMTNGSLMKIKSIEECSPWSILQYF